MHYRLTMSRGWSAWIPGVVLAGILSGCGGETAPEPAKTTPAAEKTGVSKTPGSKNAARSLTPGGDIGVRERRQQKLKERETAGKS